VPGRDEKRHEPPSDCSSCSGKENTHVDPPVSSKSSSTYNAPLERDEIWLDRHPALAFCLSMIFSENRIPLFRIML
jgi:hypothetical protein